MWAPLWGVSLAVFTVSGWGLIAVVGSGLVLVLATKALVTGKAANSFVILVLTRCGLIATVPGGFYLCMK